MKSMIKDDFSAFIIQYERLVYTICFQLVRDAAIAEDLTQETFLSAYLHRASMPAGYERQWLGRIASNKAKDYLQSAWSRRAVLPGEQEIPPGLAPPAEEIVLQDNWIQEIQKTILQLREPYGSVCRLCLLEEKTPEETAQILGRPVKTIHTQLSRGKRLLQQKLKGGEEHAHFS